MIVRRIDNIIGTERDVRGEGWNSRRILLAADGMGFSFHDTYIEAGADMNLCYKNHLEAVYCIEGKGAVHELDSGKSHSIAPGTMYALNQHDRHRLQATERLRIICVYNPPCVGSEVHDADGSYPAAP